MFLSDQISSIASTYTHRYTHAQTHTHAVKEWLLPHLVHKFHFHITNFFISNLCFSVLFQIVDFRLLIEILQKKNTHQSQGRIVPMCTGLSPFTPSVLTASLGTILSLALKRSSREEVNTCCMPTKFRALSYTEHTSFCSTDSILREKY